MAGDEEQPSERSRLIPHDRRISSITHEAEVDSIISSHLSKEEQLLGAEAVGERLAYNDYTTIDWLHDLVKDSFRYRSVHGRAGLRYDLISYFDQCQGWIAAAMIGTLTACVAFVVDVSVATVSDWKTGYCSGSPFSSKEICCTRKAPFDALADTGETCSAWHYWNGEYWPQFGIYVGWALLFGILSGSVTMTTKSALPATSPGQGDKGPLQKVASATTNGFTTQEAVIGKSMYLAAGSGIPEIKTILSGFVIPHFLDFKVLVVKAVGSVFAVSTGMCLGKEGPFVHISGCVAYLVAMCFPKYRENSRKLREVLSSGVASGLSVAFGAPIGGVLFSYEEISTFFPRKVLWRAFICSLFAAMTLRALNPTGTGRLVLFETNYGVSFKSYHYPVFILLGVAGGIFGGLFCKLNFAWARWFRSYPIIKNNPVLEVFLVVLVTAALQYPNPLTREPGDVIIKNLLVDCSSEGSAQAYVCVQEASPSTRYQDWLVYGTVVKLVLTIITFGIKVPSGIIIPALDGGAFFGRLVGQIPFLASTISPGIFAMVGAAAFLAGVCRMTISLAVIMFELTGELDFIVPNMIGIMVAKWVADAMEKEGVYDLAQTVLGHPFLDLDASMLLVQKERYLVEELVPPAQTMKEITVEVPSSGLVSRATLHEKLHQLQRRGLMDAGLVLVSKQNHMLLGYLAEGELDFSLNTLGQSFPADAKVRLLAATSMRHDPTVDEDEEELDMTQFVDRTPLTICATAPMEYVVEMFGKLGLRHLMVTDEGTGRLVGVIIKKRLVNWLDGLKHE